MHLADLIARTKSVPWAKDSKIPWHDPAFSARMLREHLSQQHDRASRRTETIDRQVRWIHDTVMHAKPGRVLDLGCGPGFYTSRLARLGHRCVGVDFSPASIAQARADAERDHLPCEYVLQDLRLCRFDTSFQSVFMISGEFNTFSPADARSVLEQAHRWIDDRGALVLEVYTDHSVRELVHGGCTWFTATKSVFSDTSHLVLREGSWHAECQTAVERYFVIECGEHDIASYTSTTQAYSDAEYASLLSEAGFNDVERFASLDGRQVSPDDELFVLVARR